MRNKRLGLFAIVLAVIAFCTSFAFATVSADENPSAVLKGIDKQEWSVVTDGTDDDKRLYANEVLYEFTVNGQTVTGKPQTIATMDDPSSTTEVNVFSFTFKLFESNGTTPMDYIDLTQASEKQYVLKVYDGDKLLAASNPFVVKIYQPKGASKVGTYILFGALILVFVGFFVWQSISNKKKRKKAETMTTGLKIGDRVKTIGGVCGFVKEINEAENTFVLETGSDQDKHCVKFDKGAIYQTAPAEGNLVAKPEDKKAKDKADAKVEEKADAPVEEKADQPAEEVKEEKPAKKSKKKEDK